MIPLAPLKPHWTPPPGGLALPTASSCKWRRVNTSVASPTSWSSASPVPARWWSGTADWFNHVHVNLVGPLPPSRGNTYLLTCVDRFTRWPEAIPLQDIRAATVARAFIENWIARFGVPSTITTDRGAQFESALWSELQRFLGCHRARTTSYHPACNGMVERLHRQLKASICAHQTASWMDALPLVLLGIRSTIKTDLQASSAELVYGTSLRLPGEFFAPSTASPATPATFVSDLRRAMAQVRPTLPRPVKRATYVPEALKTATHVFVRRDCHRYPLDAPYDGPFPVVTRTEKTVKIHRRQRQEVVSIDRCKPAFIEEAATTTRTPATPAPCAQPEDPEDSAGPELFIYPDRPPAARPPPPATRPPTPATRAPTPASRPPAAARPAPAASRPPPPAGTSTAVQPGAAAPARVRRQEHQPRSILRTRSGREVRAPVRYRRVTLDCDPSREGAV